MNKLCLYCHAWKFQRESPGLCCSNGKVSLLPLNEPPEPLKSYVSGINALSKNFLANIIKYNSAFQMTSFGATKVINDGFMPTFKIQGQIYHRIGSLLPLPDVESKFLQIYFIGDKESEISQRCAVSQGTKREIISSLRTMLHEHNNLIKLFKIALERMPSNEYKILIKADKTPIGEHQGRFNAPASDEIAVIMVGADCDKRDIILHRRDLKLERVSETHRSYDALQYPLIFWQGEGGYNFKIMQTNENANSNTTTLKKVNYLIFIVTKKRSYYVFIV